MCGTTRASITTTLNNYPPPKHRKEERTWQKQKKTKLSIYPKNTELSSSKLKSGQKQNLEEKKMDFIEPCSLNRIGSKHFQAFSFCVKV